MSATSSPLAAFVAELRRRRVHRAAGNYALGVGAVLVVEEVVAEFFGAPGWLRNALVVAGLLCFPVVVVLAWHLERGPDGRLRATQPAHAAGGAAARLADGYAAVAGQAMAFLALLILVALVALAAWARLDPDGPHGPPGSPPGQVSPPPGG